MAIELASLEVPIRVTGDTTAAGALRVVERAGQRAAAQLTTAMAGVERATVDAAGAFRVASRAAADLGTEIPDEELRAVSAEFDRLYGGAVQAAGGLDAAAVAAGVVDGATAEAAQTLRELGEVIARNKAELSAGVISQEQYARATADVRRELLLLARSGAPMSAAQFRSLNTLLVATGPTTAKATRGFGTLRSALVGLAASGVGASSQVGRIANSLLAFAGGGAVTLAVVAGAGLMAAAWEKIGAKAKEAAKKVEEARKALLGEARPEQRLAEQLGLVGGDTDAARRRLTDLETRAASLQRQLDATSASASPETWARLSAALGTVNAQIAATTAQLGQNTRATERGATALRTLGRDAIRAYADELARSITLGTASAGQRRDAVALTRILRTETIKEAGTLAERNDIIAAAAALEEALAGKTSKAARERVQALAALVASGDASVENLLELAAAERRYAAAAANTNLTLADRAEALALRDTARQALRPDLSGIEVSGALDPLLIEGMPFSPAAELDIVTRARERLTDLVIRVRDSLGNLHVPEGGAQGLFDALFGKAKEEIKNRFEDVRLTVAEASLAIAQTIKATLTDVLVGAFAAVGEAIAGGGEGLGKAMLGVLGGAVQAFGAALIAIGVQMLIAMNALASLNPVVVIAAGAALVALGAAMSAAARKSFGGLPGVSGGGSQLADTTTDITVNPRVPGASPAVATASAIKPVQPVTVNATIIGPNDPGAQAQIVALVSNAARRGLVPRTA